MALSTSRCLEPSPFDKQKVRETEHQDKEVCMGQAEKQNPTFLFTF